MPKLIYIIEVKKETSTHYGEYVSFASLEDLENEVMTDSPFYDGKPAYVVDLNNFARQRVVRETVSIK